MHFTFASFSLVVSMTLCLALSAQAQTFSKLELSSGEVFKVGTDNVLIVDTLVLHNNATIQFSPHSKAMLGARIAFVGDNCLISAKGLDGEHGSFDVDGADGEDGGDIEIDVHFMTLGSLAIDARGGNGGDGYMGKSGGKPGTSTYTKTISDGKGGFITETHTTNVDIITLGERGTPPGTGGNGGNITLTYSTDKFIVNFNHSPRKSRERKHLLEIAHEAGKNGKDGRNGSSYNGRSTRISGGIVTKRHVPVKDGTIRLRNANKPM